jgi:hypothetical protein
MAEATGSNPSLVFVKGSTIFETTYDAHRERAFSFVQRKLFLRFPDDHNLSYMQVTQVRDGNSQIVHLTNIAIPPSYHPWFDQRTDGDIEGWIEHWNISFPTREESGLTEYVFKWHVRGTGLHSRAIQELARERGDTHVVKTIIVTFTLYSYELEPPVHFEIPVTLKIDVRMRRIDRLQRGERGLLPSTDRGMGTSNQ